MKIHLLCYTTAVTTLQLNGQEEYENVGDTRAEKRNNDPYWKKRLLKDTEKIQGTSDLLAECLAGKRNKRIINTFNRIISTIIYTIDEDNRFSALEGLEMYSVDIRNKDR